MEQYKPSITVGEFKEMLSHYPDNMLLDFSMLDFNRLKQRSPTLVQVEFNQQVYRDSSNNVVVENLGQ
ncbi:hypothetical protein EGC86_20215 [Shewanella frigidimarina]|uniref:hypothetical protein n=1 Tax=Shewanella frigidimarina TaxID=56812 RepID=UPI000F4DCEE7|nr:hypothetical protein [Shewanella frigidimarina]RPA57539.1 hypothetical protein EGC86_20215 [Shewanella frigidimarina]